jgi:TonB family protein
MLKALFVLLCGVMICGSAAAQKKKNSDTLFYYVDATDKVVSEKDSAAYILMILPADGSDGKKHYPVHQYYINGQKRFIGASLTHSLNLTLDGPSIGYFPNGKRRNTINFDNGKISGSVYEYYPNGKLYSYKDYQTGIYFITYVECRDTTGKIWAENQNGKWLEWDENFKNARYTTVIDGKLDNKWYAAIDTAAYAVYEKTGVIQSDAEVAPHFDETLILLNNLLGNTLKYPEKDLDKKTSGKVSLSVVVEKDGTVTHPKIIESPSVTLGEEALRLVGLTSPWMPGYDKLNGEPIRVKTNLALNFELKKTTFNTIRTDVNTINYYTDEEYNKTGPTFSVVDKRPEFPGGLNLFGKFLAANIVYPASDREKGIQGRVLLEFIVERDGSLSNIKGIIGPSAEMIEEAVNTMKLSPKWNIAVKDGKVVRCSYTMPIAFALDDTYNRVDKQPEFPGGIEGFIRFITNHLQHPQINKDQNPYGRVLIKFVVEQDGRITNVKVARSENEVLSDEAVRVIKLSPKWEPGSKNGKPVSVSYTIPISFDTN